MYGFGSMNAEHQPKIDAIGWGEPPTYYPSCSCGWKGINIDSYPPESLLKGIKESSELKPYIDKYGLSKVVRQPDEALGVKNDAIIQVLEHIKYNPKLDRTYHLQTVETLIKKYKISIDEREFSQALNLSQKLEKATQDVLDMNNRVKVFENYSLNIDSFDPEIYSIYQRVLDDLTKPIERVE